MGVRYIRLRLEELLKERGMTRWQLHEISEIPYQTVDKYYKNNVFRYDSEIILRLCEALQCQLTDLIQMKY